MKPTPSTTLLTLILMFFIGIVPLFADHATIGENGTLSINRPFCGT